jgi:hypothetical protein
MGLGMEVGGGAADLGLGRVRRDGKKNWVGDGLGEREGNRSQ